MCLAPLQVTDPTYMSDDGTVVAIFYLSKRVDGFQLFSNLSDEAMVSASNAFLLEVSRTTSSSLSFCRTRIPKR